MVILWQGIYFFNPIQDARLILIELINNCKILFNRQMGPCQTKEDKATTQKVRIDTEPKFKDTGQGLYISIYPSYKNTQETNMFTQTSNKQKEPNQNETFGFENSLITRPPNNDSTALVNSAPIPPRQKPQRQERLTQTAHQQRHQESAPESKKITREASIQTEVTTLLVQSIPDETVPINQTNYAWKTIIFELS